MANTNVEDGAWVRVLEVLSMYCVPMAVQAAVKLNVMEILAFADQELSAQEIMARIKATSIPSVSNPTAHVTLDRVLRVLATQGVLSSSLHEEGDAQPPVRKYGPTPVSRYLASGPQGGPSLGVLCTFSLQKAFIDAWQLLDKAVLTGTDAFTLAHGKPTFLFGQGDPQFAQNFDAAMSNQTDLLMPLLLQSYDGFLNVNTLVDVGGGIGAALRAIVSKYRHIKGINFDQPHVVASAPSFSGVEHVGGDMFKSIPQGDAILLKIVLHNWTDELCVEILKNCYKALPKKGKVIVVDIILSPKVETTPISRVQSNLDLIMLTLFNGGKERTFQELQVLAIAGGFKRSCLVTQVHDTSVVELYKD